MKIRPSSEGVSIELPVTTSVLASFFAFTTLVLLGVTGYLLKLLRFERSRNRGSDEAPVPPGPTGLALPDGAPQAVEQQQQQQQLQGRPPLNINHVRPAPPPPPNNNSWGSSGHSVGWPSISGPPHPRPSLRGFVTLPSSHGQPTEPSSVNNNNNNNNNITNRYNTK